MTSDELTDGLHQVQALLGCEIGRAEPSDIVNVKKHVKHAAGSLNCSEMVLQDLAYRTLMNYENEWGL